MLSYLLSILLKNSDATTEHCETGNTELWLNYSMKVKCILLSNNFNKLFS